LPDIPVRTQEQTEHPPEEELLLRLWQQAKHFVVQNWTHVLLVVALAAAVIAGWRLYSLHRRANELRAWDTLNSVPPDSALAAMPAREADERRQEAVNYLGEFLADSPRTSATPWIMLQLGNLHAALKHWPQAVQAYADLASKWPQTAAARLARPAWAAALEQMGKYAEAGNLYEAVAAEQPRHLLAAARCRELAGDDAAAMLLYDRFLDSGAADDLLAEVAKSRLKAVREGKLLTAPPPITEAPPVERPQEQLPIELPAAEPAPEPAADAPVGEPETASQAPQTETDESP